MSVKSETVDIKSNQKKKLPKYSSCAKDERPNSIVNRAITTIVILLNVTSFD